MTKSAESCDLVVSHDGLVRMIYSEIVVPLDLGVVEIRRGSHVEPDNYGKWHADLSPCGGPTLGPFDLRSDAINAEIAWLTEYWLQST